MLGIAKAIISIDPNNILYEIIKTTYIKKIVNTLFIVCVTFIIRTLLFNFLSIVLALNNMFVDFIMQTLISIFLCTKTRYIHGIVDIFRDDMYKITRYIINNYTEENYRKWKHCVIFGTSLLALLYFSFFEITSRMMQLYILQYVVCYICVDITENETHFARIKFREIKKKYQDFKKNNKKRKQDKIQNDKIYEKNKEQLSKKFSKSRSSFEIIPDDECIDSNNYLSDENKKSYKKNSSHEFELLD